MRRLEINKSQCVLVAGARISRKALTLEQIDLLHRGVRVGPNRIRGITHPANRGVLVVGEVLCETTGDDESSHNLEGPDLVSTEVETALDTLLEELGAKDNAERGLFAVSGAGAEGLSVVVHAVVDEDEDDWTTTPGQRRDATGAYLESHELDGGGIEAVPTTGAELWELASALPDSDDVTIRLIDTSDIEDTEEDTSDYGDGDYPDVDDDDDDEW